MTITAPNASVPRSLRFFAVALIAAGPITACEQKEPSPAEASKASAAPSAAPAEPPKKEQPAKVKLPDPVKLNTAGVHAGTSVTVTKFQQVDPTPKSDKPSDSQKLVAVSLEVRATGGSAMYAGALFDLVDGAGKRYRASILPCTDKPLGSGSLTGTNEAKGDLCFVVPKSATDVKLMFKSGGKDALPFALQS